jgi:hypothetical protein
MLLAKPDLLMADFTGVRLKTLGLDDDLCSSNDDTDSIAVGSALHARLPEPRVAANSCCNEPSAIPSSAARNTWARYFWIDYDACLMSI